MSEAGNYNNRAQLISDLKNMIVQTLNLDDVDPEDIEDGEPLFNSKLDLDSIDALELVVGLEKKYNIKIESSEESKAALQSVNTLADLISGNA